MSGRNPFLNGVENKLSGRLKLIANFLSADWALSS